MSTLNTQNNLIFQCLDFEFRRLETWLFFIDSIVSCDVALEELNEFKIIHLINNLLAVAFIHINLDDKPRLVFLEFQGILDAS